MTTIQSDFIASFNAIASDVHATAKDKGWWEFQSAEDWYRNIGSREEYYTIQGDEDKQTALMAAYRSGQQNPPPNPAERIALMHSELSEALEGLRDPGPDKHCPEFTKEEVEKADVIIRIMDDAKHGNLRIAEAVIAKAAYNKTREYKHGGKKF
jgi:hypothetical protein